MSDLLIFYWTYDILTLEKNRKEGQKMEKIKKEKITLSLPSATKADLEELSKRYGMTKSGLIHFLLQRLKERGDLFK